VDEAALSAGAHVEGGVLRLTRDPQLLAPFRTHYSFYYIATLTPAGFKNYFSQQLT
jgi:hypothetical protein